jgi:glycosyltransferase involved in cell wall biosynthesis
MLKTPMERIGVLQISDTLELGGYERVAVTLANLLPRDRYRSYLCTTRKDGPLEEAVAADVGRLRLERRRAIDVPAIRRLVAFIRQHRVQILHAHSSTVFLARLAALFPPHPAVIWHAHFGHSKAEPRMVPPFWLATRGVAAVITVNELLSEWTRRNLAVPAGRIRYVPNVAADPEPQSATPELPGVAGKRIVCVANLRPQKDHPNLIEAMSLVTSREPDAHLLLAGVSSDPEYQRRLEQDIEARGLRNNITYLGPRKDVAAILSACDIGVLGSRSEGLPIALLEYGMAGLPSVATEVGQCLEVLDEGRAGILVPPAQPAQLADALLLLLSSPDLRRRLGAVFQRYVRARFSRQAVMPKICAIYEAALGGKAIPEHVGR